MTLLSVVNGSDYDVALSPNISSYDRFITVLQTTVIAVISSGIILSNIINLIVLVSASGAMPWATRLFLINLSVSDVLVGVIACAPAVLPAATDRWTYGAAWCQVSGIVHGTSVTVSIWSISMIGLYRLGPICFLTALTVNPYASGSGYSVYHMTCPNWHHLFCFMQEKDKTGVANLRNNLDFYNYRRGFLLLGLRIPHFSPAASHKMYRRSTMRSVYIANTKQTSQIVVIGIYFDLAGSVKK